MNFLQTGHKGKNESWMYVVMFFIIFLGSTLGQIPITIKVLLSFIIPLLLFIPLVKSIHKKKIRWIITSRKKIDWSRFFFGVFIWGLVTIFFLGSDILLSPEKYVWNFKPIPFFTLCFIAIVFIPLQTSLEELLFRGYYMQGLALWIKNKWAPLIIMSVVFGLLHGLNPEIEKLGYIALVFYIGTGFFFGIVTLMDDGIELAMGMHAVNNILAALFVTTDWTVFQTEALFIDVSEPSLGVEMFLPLVVLYPIVFLIFSKKYGWSNWKERIFGKLEKPSLIEIE